MAPSLPVSAMPIPSGDGIEALLGLRAEEMQLYAGKESGELHINLESRRAKGVIDFYPVNSAISVAISDFVPSGDPLTTVMDREVVKLNVQLAGGGHFDLGGDRTFGAAEMSAAICYHPAGMVKREYYRPNERQAAVTLMCDIPYLRSILSDSLGHMPSALRDLVEGKATDYFSLTFPCPTEMLIASETMRDHGHRPDFRRLEAHARSFELMFRFFRRMQELEESRSGRSGMTHADIKLVEAARELIEHHYDQPLTITRIARHVGASETKLSGLFKARFGTTIMGYLTHVRMERARHLLRDSDLSITQVALDIGYEHSGNFSTAFRRIYGLTPRAFKHH